MIEVDGATTEVNPGFLIFEEKFLRINEINDPVSFSSGFNYSSRSQYRQMVRNLRLTHVQGLNDF